MPPPELSPWAIEAEGLVKRFGTFTAVDGLSLQVPRGAFYAFLGPNGAGKSTSIALFTGIYRADAPSNSSSPWACWPSTRPPASIRSRGDGAVRV
jgi:energy-coupling factor transporter ATP-binding protein EcfA2